MAMDGGEVQGGVATSRPGVYVEGHTSFLNSVPEMGLQCQSPFFKPPFCPTEVIACGSPQRVEDPVFPVFGDPVQHGEA